MVPFTIAQESFTDDSSVEELIKLMADGHFHSGQKLGAQLGITRAAVWKKLKDLVSLGLPVERVKGKGYRLSKLFQPICRTQVQSHLSPQVMKRVNLSTKLIVTSTSDVVREQADCGKAVQICVADYQSAGRGRRGRHWQSPLGACISFSLQKKIEGGIAAVDGLSLVAGLAVVSALEMLGCKNLSLKWPNDVMWDKKKLAGILLELEGDPNGICTVVIGIGVNIRIPGAMRSSIGQPVAELCHILPSRMLDKNLLIAHLTTAMIDHLDTFDSQGFVAFMSQWQSYDCFAGCQVRLLRSSDVLEGKALGVNEQGAFLLEIHNKPEAFSCGEVSLREAE